MVSSHLAQDLRYTLRSLRRNAGFAVFAILIAGLGIGASSTVFSVVNTLLLRPLPFEKPSELVWIANGDPPDLSGQTTQVGHLLDLRERTQTLSAVAGYFAFYGVGDNLLSGRGEPERLSGVPVSENFFDVLGVKPLLGRTFNARESTWNGPKAVMLGYALWERRFNRDPGDRRHVARHQRRAAHGGGRAARRRSTSRPSSRRAAASTSTSPFRSARRPIAGATRWR